MAQKELNKAFCSANFPDGHTHDYVEVFFSQGATIYDIANFAPGQATKATQYLSDVLAAEKYACVVYQVKGDRASQAAFLQAAKMSPAVMGVATHVDKTNTNHIVHQKEGFYHPGLRSGASSRFVLGAAKTSPLIPAPNLYGNEGAQNADSVENPGLVLR